MTRGCARSSAPIAAFLERLDAVAAPPASAGLLRLLVWLVAEDLGLRRGGRWAGLRGRSRGCRRRWRASCRGRRAAEGGAAPAHPALGRAAPDLPSLARRPPAVRGRHVPVRRWSTSRWRRMTGYGLRLAVRRALLAGALVLSCAAGARAQISPGTAQPVPRRRWRARGTAAPATARRASRASCASPATPRWPRGSAPGEGLHARAEYRVGCERCHVEHQGRGFELVFWGKEGRAAFDHAQTGFPLQGRHAALACGSCHTRPHPGPRGAWRAAASTSRARSWASRPRALVPRGSAPVAASGPTARLPRGRGLVRIEPGRFDHDKTRVPADRRARDVACAGCHAPRPGGRDAFQGHAVPDLRDLPPGSARRPPGAACATCHSTAGLDRIQPGQFDHDRTGFPLRGQHAEVSAIPAIARAAREAAEHARCTDCHGTGTPASSRRGRTAGAASRATTWTASSPRASRSTTTRARACP